MGTNFTTWIEFLYWKDKSASVDAHADMEYPEMVQIFRSMKDLLIKYRPEPQSTLQEFADANKQTKIEKLQWIEQKVKLWVTLKESDYHSLYNSLTPTRKQQLTDIINATKKWNYREDSVEYTRNELLEKRWFSEFIWLV